MNVILIIGYSYITIVMEEHVLHEVGNKLFTSPSCIKASRTLHSYHRVCERN